jgi:hypothetical protein
VEPRTILVVGLQDRLAVLPGLTVLADVQGLRENAQRQATPVLPAGVRFAPGTSGRVTIRLRVRPLPRGEGSGSVPVNPAPGRRRKRACYARRGEPRSRRRRSAPTVAAPWLPPHPTSVNSRRRKLALDRFRLVALAPPPRVLFGTDGVRGVANTELSPCARSCARGRGRARAAPDASRGDRPHVVVGRDPRISGDALEAALAAGFCAAGVDVLRLDVVPTPAVAFVTRERNALAGVMVSASHNPGAGQRHQVLRPQTGANCPTRSKPK